MVPMPQKYTMTEPYILFFSQRSLSDSAILNVCVTVLSVLGFQSCKYKLNFDFFRFYETHGLDFMIWYILRFIEIEK